MDGDDFTTKGGAADRVICYKAGYVELMAREPGLPIVRLVDGRRWLACQNGRNNQVYLPPCQSIMGRCRRNDEEAFATVRRFLSFMPSNVWQTPPHRSSTDDPNRREQELLSIIPRDRRRGYDIQHLVSRVLDRDSFFEIGRYYGGPLLTGFARLDSYPVGVRESHSMQGGGGLAATGSEKTTRFIDQCDTFHLLCVNFVDQPGFLIVTAAERAGTIRYGMRALAAVFLASVPWVSIIVRRRFGVSGAARGNTQMLTLRYAWPSGDRGSLPIEVGVISAYKRVIESASDPDRCRREIEAKVDSLHSPLRTAEAFGIEEIIHPHETRPLLCTWVQTACDIIPSQLGPTTRRF